MTIIFWILAIIGLITIVGNARSYILEKQEKERAKRRIPQQEFAQRAHEALLRKVHERNLRMEAERFAKVK